METHDLSRRNGEVDIFDRFYLARLAPYQALHGSLQPAFAHRDQVGLAEIATLNDVLCGIQETEGSLCTPLRSQGVVPSALVR